MSYDSKTSFSNYRRHHNDKNIDDEMLRVVHKSNQVAKIQWNSQLFVMTQHKKELIGPCMTLKQLLSSIGFEPTTCESCYLSAQAQVKLIYSFFLI